MTTEDPVMTVTRALTDEERGLIVDRFVAWNPSYRGAEAADVLETLDQYDGHLDKTEPFYEEHGGELPDIRPARGLAVLALAAMGRELTVPAVVDILQRAGLAKPPAPAEVWYRGTADGTTVAVEDQDGHLIERLPHIEHAVSNCHSPTGFGWGYPGSGAAELARNLLLHVLGATGAKCPTCEGTRLTVWDPTVDEEVPYQPGADLDEEAMECSACEDGYRVVPYQDFKSVFVAGWENGWRMSRAEILAWLGPAFTLAAGEQQR